MPSPVHVTVKDEATSVTPPSVHIPATPPHGGVTTISRRPAAIAGILVASSIGLTLAFGGNFTGRNTVTVRISAQGFSPQTVQVTTGTRVKWVNDSPETHTLQSDQLCTRDRRCLSTSALAPGASAILTIAQDFSSGTYSYYSINGQGLEGSITIRTSNNSTPTATTETSMENMELTQPIDAFAANITPPAGQSSSSIASAPNGTDGSASTSTPAALVQTVSSAQSNTETSSVRDDQATTRALMASNETEDPPETSLGNALAGADESSSLRTYADVSGLLPMNPYTVGSNRAQAAAQAASGGSSAKVTGTLHGGAPLRRPLAQPSSGPGLWAVLTGSFLLLFFGTRKLLRKAVIE